MAGCLCDQAFQGRVRISRSFPGENQKQGSLRRRAFRKGKAPRDETGSIKFTVRRRKPRTLYRRTMKVTIDGQEIHVEPGTTILQAARMIGGESVPPAMCYYSKLKGSGGKCRCCLVEVSKGSDANPTPMPKLVASCVTGVMDGMEVKSISSERVVDARKSVTEFLLINHPLDCPVCDQAGECDLQNLSFKHGNAKTRFIEEKRPFEPENIGDKIQLHMTRCILCYRCVMTADQLTDSRVHGVMNRGDHSQISTYISKAINNEF